MEPTPGRTSERHDFRVVLFTDRPSVSTFFASLGGRRGSAVSTLVVDANASTLARASSGVMAASVAVVDALDPAEALEICERVRALQPDLRIALLYCCPCAASSDSLRPFLDAGIGSFLDLQLSAEQTLGALRAIARGEDVMRLHLGADASRALFGGQPEVVQLSADDLTLLRLVALGMTDQEIGVQMCLSHHTIKHRIERLRRRQHARNRIQLAAFAARLESGMRGVRMS